MRKQKGFSLIELLIVVAIILIIAAIAIPSLLRSRILANQSSAASTVRTLVTAEITYESTFGAIVGYAPLMANLGTGGPGACAPAPAVPTAAAACLIDPQLATTFQKNGYQFQVAAGFLGVPPPGLGPTDFSISAAPNSPGSTGVNSYCAGTDGVVWVNTAGSPIVLALVTCGLPFQVLSQ